MPVAFDATLNAQRKSFDKGINERVLALPASTRGQQALDLPARAIRGVGDGGMALLEAATGDQDVTIRKLNAFMSQPNAGQALAAQVLGSGTGMVPVGGNVPGILIRAWQRLG